MEEATSVAVEQCLRAAGQKSTQMEPAPGTVYISASSDWAPVRLGELWDYRELLYFLAWRDVTVRYRQTILGAVWALLKPLCLVLVFSIVFGWLAAMPSDGLPYPLFSLCGILPWQLFSQILMGTSQSLVASQNLLSKVYFPRLIIPLSTMISGLADFLIALAVLFGVMGYYQVAPTHAWALPLFVLLAVATSLGGGLWLAALNVQHRDIGHALPFLLQLLFFATPIAYPSSLIPEPWRLWYGLNPITTVIEGFRWSLLGAPNLSTPMLLLSFLVALVLIGSGLLYFHWMEQTFADVV